MQGDVGDPASVQRFFDEAVKTFGGLDVLVNNAGVGAGGATVEEIDDTQVERVLRTDLMGRCLLSRLRQATQAMRRRRTHRQHLFGRAASADAGERTVWDG